MCIYNKLPTWRKLGRISMRRRTLITVTIRLHSTGRKEKCSEFKMTGQNEISVDSSERSRDSTEYFSRVASDTVWSQHKEDAPIRIRSRQQCFHETEQLQGCSSGSNWLLATSVSSLNLKRKFGETATTPERQISAERIWHTRNIVFSLTVNRQISTLNARSSVNSTGSLLWGQSPINESDLYFRPPRSSKWCADHMKNKRNQSAQREPHTQVPTKTESKRQGLTASRCWVTSKLPLIKTGMSVRRTKRLNKYHRRTSQSCKNILQLRVYILQWT